MKIVNNNKIKPRLTTIIVKLDKIKVSNKKHETKKT